MKFVKSNYRKKALILLLLSFGMILTNLGLSLFNSPFLNSNYEEGNTIDFNDQDVLPITSEYQNFNGAGENFNISLHQSYLNNSFNTLINTSDSNSNSFSLPSPKDVNFNSSFTKVTVEDIYAPNKSLIVEDDSVGVGFESFFINNYYVSFIPKGVGYIENISLLIKLLNIGDPANLTIRLYDSENDGGNIRPLNNLGTIVTLSNVTSDTYYWHKITDIHTLYNCSETYNNTFFFRVGVIGGNVYWDWSNDVGNDGVDEMIALNAA